MAAVDKVNGDVVALATLYSTAQVKVFEINPASALTASTQAGGEGTAITKGTAQLVAEALSPMLFEVKSDGDVMIVVMDGHANTAASVKARVDHLFDVDNTVVTESSTMLNLA